MATAEVLLIKPVDGLGAEGDEAKVKAGFARNYLVPQKLAVPLTEANRKQIEALKKARAKREIKDQQIAEELKTRLEDIHIAVQVRVGEEGKMFGAVTAQDIFDHIAKQGVEVERKKILPKEKAIWRKKEVSYENRFCRKKKYLVETKTLYVLTT